MKIQLVAPLAVEIDTKKRDKWVLNLNKYRNSHYQILNKAKIAYEKVMSEQILNKVPAITVPLQITYIIIPNSQRLFDIDNVCSVHDKFFRDTLVNLGKIEDDSYQHIPRTIYQAGLPEIKRGRMLITLESAIETIF